MSPSNQFRAKTFFPIIDAMNSNLAGLGTVYSYAADRFSFLVNFEMSSEDVNTLTGMGFDPKMIFGGNQCFRFFN